MCRHLQQGRAGSAGCDRQRAFAMLAEGQQAAAVRESIRTTRGKRMTFLCRKLAMDVVPHGSSD